MDYFFSQIILDLQERIEKEVPEIVYIDQDLGQLGMQDEDEKPPLSYPACLIDFPDSNFTELAQGSQLGDVPISLQLIFNTYSQTWNKVPTTVRKKGLEYLNIEQKLYNTLQGWHLEYFSPLIRTSVKSQNNNDIGLRVRNLTFTTQYEDYSPIKQEPAEIEFSFKQFLNGD